MKKLGLTPFIQDWVELANGEATLSEVCMCRVHLSEDEETLDLPVYVMNSDNEQALFGMDILALGDFSVIHTQDSQGPPWVSFQFNIIEDTSIF